MDKEDFERLLRWLDPDREKAGEKYEQIRFKLIKIYERRGCIVPDELADETIDRVSKKLPEIADTYTGDKSLYFYGFVKYVYQDYLRRLRRPIPQPPPKPVESEEEDQRHECLDECLAKLNEGDRQFILEYFQGDKSDKIKNRKKMAESRKASIEALRMRAHRIKAVLKKCVRDCLARKQ